MKINAIDINGRIKEYDAILTYHSNEYNKNYVVYTDNEYDNNAIQIRRWFPVEKKIDNPEKPFFLTYEYGYVSKAENQELHSFMMKKSRILFAKIYDKKIHVIGGLEAFKKELVNYYVPPFILEFLK